MLYAVLTVSLVALDQLVKYLVRTNIPLGESIPFLPHLMNLTYTQNTGAAFSLFQDYTWVLTFISLVVAVGLAVCIWRRSIFTHPIGLMILSLVLAGAVGNLIDRLCLGYVTDMFQTIFIDFAIFNVADICVVLGGIGIVAYAYFGSRFENKGGTGHDAPSTDR